jgi:hypothetical protein
LEGRKEGGRKRRKERGREERKKRVTFANSYNEKRKVRKT